LFFSEGGFPALSSAYLGELAALGAATVWTFSSLFFTIAGRRVGAFAVNRMRLVFAVLLVGAAHWLIYGQPFPSGADGYRIFWLGMSAIVGLVIGDTFLFQCYVLVGARIGVLMFVLGPPFGALLSWLFLGEGMTGVELLAMALVLAGVLWVVLERYASIGGRGLAVASVERRNFGLGILFGVLAQLCQQANLVMAKQGLAGGYPALSGVMIRMVTGLVVIWLLAVIQREVGRTIRAVRADGRAAAAIFGGAFTGPFLGVWLSMIAVQASRVGVASTLMALTPVISLPVVRLVLKEQVSRRAVLGTLVAMAGVALMVLA
jgi:drug/metabolite transporter (DMT)-like permease